MNSTLHVGKKFEEFYFIEKKQKYNDMSNDYNWCIFIDIEGFSCLYNSPKNRDIAKNLVKKTIQDLYYLGLNVSFLSITQFGVDGFLIRQCFQSSKDWNIPIDISISILKSMLINGGLGRAQISFGEMYDYIGSLNDEISEQPQIKEGNNYLKLKKGLMVINRFMGNAIINSYKLKGQKGALIIVDPSFQNRINYTKYPIIQIENHNYINWIKSKSGEITRYMKFMMEKNDGSLENKLINYFELFNLEEIKDNDWYINSKRLLND